MSTDVVGAVAERRIGRIVAVPPLAPGFVGPGHLASHVLSAEEFADNDPFILLADDHLDIGERPVGGPHPHAGFETVTLLLDGAIVDRDEGGVVNAGDVQWMTAGRGIIHGENVAAQGYVRLLQLWLTLPKRDRWTTPSFQDVKSDKAPVRRENGVEARVYSGASGGLRAATRNYVPTTIVELKMTPEAAFEQDLPVSYNGFVFVLNGEVRAGDGEQAVKAGYVGWLDRPGGTGESVLRLRAGDGGARLVLYAGEPQGDPIVSHGPFIGDSRDDIVRLYGEYRAGRFERMSDLVRKAKTA